jgi:predicted Fe-S protein YdhL (DUF1289 family)
MNDRDTPDAPEARLLSDSPCIGVCTLDADEQCIGCRRTRAEIAGWSTFDEATRDAINRRNLPHAHPAVSVRLLGHAGGGQPRRGGRRGRSR